MTEQEAIKALKLEGGIEITGRAKRCADFCMALDTAIQALEEVQEYRKIGILKELKIGKRYMELAKMHGTIGQVIDKCAEYEEIGTVEECRAAVEKQKPKKARRVGSELYKRTYCPNCNTFLGWNGVQSFCSCCGQGLDWSNEENG